MSHLNTAYMLGVHKAHEDFSKHSAWGNYSVPIVHNGQVIATIPLQATEQFNPNDPAWKQQHDIILQETLDWLRNTPPEKQKKVFVPGHDVVLT